MNIRTNMNRLKNNDQFQYEEKLKPVRFDHYNDEITQEEKKSPNKKFRKNLKYSGKKSEGSSELSEDNKSGPGSYEEFFTTV